MKGRPITLEEFERMIEAVPKVIKKNDIVESWRFYLRGLWFSGLRLTESMNLCWDSEDEVSVDLHSHKFPMIKIRAEAEKGNKDRLLPIVPEFVQFLLSVPEADRVGHVFNPLPERSNGKRITPLAVSKKISKIGEKANVVVGDKGNIDKFTGERKSRYASAHDLRRAFGERLSHKVMPQDLMQIMRHEDMSTTMKYYVGRNAEKAAQSLWDAVTNPGTNSGTSSIPESGPPKERSHNSL